MLLIIRFIVLALLLIFAALILPTLRLGGRYFILLEAAIVAIIAQLIRNLFQGQLPYRGRNFVAGLSVFGLFLTKIILPDFNCTLGGIILLYLGASLLEMVLPNRIVTFNNRK